VRVVWIQEVLRVQRRDVGEMVRLRDAFGELNEQEKSARSGRSWLLLALALRLLTGGLLTLGWLLLLAF
jgi:hypothetical protein